MIPFSEGAESLATALWRASLDGALFIAAVWILIRLVPRIPASLRAGLWWIAALKVVVGLVWVTPLVVPVLPPRQAEVMHAGPVFAQPVPDVGTVLPMQATGGTNHPPRNLPWRQGLVVVWFAGLAMLAIRAGRDLLRARAIRARSLEVSDPRIAAIFGGLARQFGIGNTELRMSSEMNGPHVFGIWHPVVLVPSGDVGRLSESEWEMVLAHELMHVKRCDLRFGWIPFLAARLFFFHPLVALAAREYVLAREAACDAAVIASLNASPRSYGRLLLSLSATSRAIGSATAVGATSAHRALKRRLGMLEQVVSGRRFPSGLRWLLASAAVAGLVPLQLVERAIEPPDADPVASVTHVDVAPSLAAFASAANPIAAEPVGAETSVDATAMAAAEASGEATPEEAPSEEALTKEEITAWATQVAGAALEGSSPSAIARLLPALEATSSPESDCNHEGGQKTSPEEAVRMSLPELVVKPGTRILSPADLGNAVRRVWNVAPALAGRLVWASNGGGPVYVAAEEAVDVDAEVDAAADAQAEAQEEADWSWHWQGQAEEHTEHVGGHGEFFVLVKGDEQSFMSGSRADLERAKKLRTRVRGDYILFRKGGQLHMVRDRALIAAADRALEPQRELGRRQGELGRRQAELGQKQGALGQQQGALGREQREFGALSGELAALHAEVAHLHAARRISERRRDELEARMEDLSDRIHDLAERQRDLGLNQSELGVEQAALGAKQAELGAQQAALGQLQREAGSAARQVLRKITERAMKERKAEVVR